MTGEQMAGMDAEPGTDPGSVGFYVSAWVVMMAAMAALFALGVMSVGWMAPRPTRR